MTDERWQLAYAIYEAAAPLGEPQRSQYVRTAAPDAEIAAKVLAMLDEMEATADTGASPEHTDSKNPAAPLVPPMVLYPGAEIGSYQILKPLGSGGMSDVYLAYDRRLDRRVAIKLLPAHLAADAVARDRLRREALAAAALDHPFICKIFEIGEDKGTLFIVMEYISGETLYARMRAGPLRRTEALRIAVEVAEALEEAHAKRLVHRDLKPANVMLTSQGRAKVMDFGLAKGPVSDEIKDVDARAAGPTLTAAGTVVGTPEYMSPEQMTGAPLDHRSDLFSFGVILCELLTGKHPFQRNSKLETMTAILRDSPDLPVTGKAGLSQGEMVLIRRLLAKLPDERYQSMREVRDDLAKLEPGPHEGPLRIVHAQGLPLRRRWSLVLTGLLVMVAASGLVWFAGHRAPSARPEPKPIGVVIEELNGELQDAFFDYDRSALTSDGLSALRQDAALLVSVLAGFPQLKVTVEGHCDERGSAEYNLALGDDRASRAGEALQRFGVPARNLEVVSYGKERPQCAEPAESCWHRNRRAHLRVEKAGPTG